MLAPAGTPAAVVLPRSTDGRRRGHAGGLPARGPGRARAAPAPGLAGSSNAVDGAITLVMTRMDAVLEVVAGRPARRRPAGRGEQDAARRRRRVRAVLSAGPLQLRLVHDRRQPVDQLRRPVLREVRRHHRLRARAWRSCSPTGGCCAPAGARSRASPATTWPGCSSGSEGTLGVITEATLALRPGTAAAGHARRHLRDDGADRAGRRAGGDQRPGAQPARGHGQHLHLRRRRPAQGRPRPLRPRAAGGAVRQRRRAAAVAEIEALAQLCREAGAEFVHTTDDPAEGDLLLQARRMALPALERLGSTLIDDVAVPRSRHRRVPRRLRRDRRGPRADHRRRRARRRRQHAPHHLLRPRRRRPARAGLRRLRRHPRAGAVAGRHDHRRARRGRDQGRLAGARDRRRWRWTCTGRSRTRSTRPACSTRARCSAGVGARDLAAVGPLCGSLTCGRRRRG